MTIRQILEILPSEEFIQCHRMYVIHRKYVDYVDMVNQIVQMQGYKEEVEIGKTYKSDVKRRLNA